ncbi:MAG TPA: 50S ribosomal protein L5, partial [bacterium]|nr:50S ribosomal protein L5 [bacterium]
EANLQLSNITGQKPIIRRAKKSISNFKLRQGIPIGLKVTLRGWKKYEFLDRFINIAVPRLRDFRGLPANTFDQVGNYTLGLSDITIFPEIDIEKMSRQYGLSITIVMDKGKKEERSRLLELLGLPFQKNKKE